MTIPIVLYDENHERVGETYHRRAKQLVRSGRAKWLIEGQSLLLVPSQDAHTSIPPKEGGGVWGSAPFKKEEPTMTESISSNGIAPEAPRPGGDNTLLMYLAKQNVAQKRNLIKNVVAYALVWLALIAMPIGALNRTASSLSRRGLSPFAASATATAVQGGLEALLIPELPELRSFRLQPGNSDVRAYIFNHVHEGISGSFSRSGDVIVMEPFLAPPSFHIATGANNFWYFMVGIMFAWGVWIAARGLSIARRHTGSRASLPKPDPVEMEYQRLISIPQ